MIQTAQFRETFMEEKVSGPCQCADLLTITPCEDEMAGLKVKSHLESLMGTDVIKLNDREYMLSLQSRLMKEYDTIMDKQEEQRSEKERRRQRRLYIEGLQDLPNIDLKSAKSRSAGYSSISKTTRRHSGERKSTVHYGFDSEEDEYMYPPVGQSANPTRQKSKERYRVKISAKDNKENKQEDEDCPVNLSTHKVTGEERKAMMDRYPNDEEELNTQRAVLMRRLRNESTVKGMYTTADQVLSAPVTELNAETRSVAGSPRSSSSSRKSPNRSTDSRRKSTNR